MGPCEISCAAFVLTGILLGAFYAMTSATDIIITTGMDISNRPEGGLPGAQQALQYDRMCSPYP